MSMEGWSMEVMTYRLMRVVLARLVLTTGNNGLFGVIEGTDLGARDQAPAAHKNGGRQIRIPLNARADLPTAST
eukprot:6196571-Pleurochrysis_carterae.AAC.4